MAPLAEKAPPDEGGAASLTAAMRRAGEPRMRLVVHRQQRTSRISKWIDVSISVTLAFPKKMLPPSAAVLFALKTVGYCVVRGSSFGLT